MSIRLYDPVGVPEVIQAAQRRRFASLHGLRVGYIFNQHTSAQLFWKALEGEVQEQLAPVDAQRIYKTNTWAPAPKVQMDRLIAETDFALVGVGA